VRLNNAIFVLAGFGILGCVCLGFVICLGNYVTNEYVDHGLPGSPVIQEYDFRIGGEYGFITLFFLLSGCVLAIGGNFACISMMQKQQLSRQSPIESKDRFAEKRVWNGLVMICQQCRQMLPTESRFCPKCGSTSLQLQRIVSRKIHETESVQTSAST